MRTIRELTLRTAKDKPGWGYTRIVGALTNVGHTVARKLVAKILKAAGIAPAPERPTSWRTLPKAHAGTIAADLCSVEVWTVRWLVTHYVQLAIDLATRAGARRGHDHNPGGAFMTQVARNLTDAVDGFLRGKNVLVVDRETKFAQAFRKTLAGAGIETVLTAVRALPCGWPGPYLCPRPTSCNHFDISLMPIENQVCVSRLRNPKLTHPCRSPNHVSPWMWADTGGQPLLSVAFSAAIHIESC